MESMSKISSRPSPYLVVAGLAALILFVYWQVGGYSFTGFDDDVYVYENSHVQRGMTKDSLKWAFTTFHASNWHPLTWVSYMVDTELFGFSAGWHHRMNGVYHILNTELLFLVLWGMTGGLWPSAFVAALFGVHPLHVESVAWIAERKDVLSTLFWFLTMAAYLRYVRRPNFRRYVPVAAFFALGLMSKPMLVTLPLVLLLLDWWPLGRMTSKDSQGFSSGSYALFKFFRLAWEKAPLLGLSAVSCVITLLAQTKGDAVRSLDYVPFGIRLFNSFVSYVFYLWKAVWPSSLAVFYPHPASIQAEIPFLKIGGAVGLLAGLSLLVLWQGKRRPYLPVGWLWYLGTLVPVIGLVQVGDQAVADRYTYVPLVGVFIALAWSIHSAFLKRRFVRLALGLLGGGAVVALAMVAWNQTAYWRDSVTLYSRALRVTENNWLAWNNLGFTYEKMGQREQAIACYHEALRIKPNQPIAWNNLGGLYMKMGRLQEALEDLQIAIKLNPYLAKAHSSLGFIYAKMGLLEESIEHLETAVQIDPMYGEAHHNLGVVYKMKGWIDKAIEEFQIASALIPNYPQISGAYHDKSTPVNQSHGVGSP
jgi:Tfp pilus assembly protein PilF